jgi:co-chaperonin GroES (HSP10)
MLKPLGDHVVVEIVEHVEKTASGIYLPDTASKEKPQEGKVIAVGAGRVLDNGKRVDARKLRKATKLFSLSIPEPNSRWVRRNI